MVAESVPGTYEIHFLEVDGRWFVPGIKTLEEVKMILRGLKRISYEAIAVAYVHDDGSLEIIEREGGYFTL